jgi:hypothetical protein
MPPPLTEIADATRPSAAEEARTIAAATNVATLASLTRTGDPWASFVTYGLLDTGSCGGAPVLCVSHLAEHGRNLAADPRHAAKLAEMEALLLAEMRRLDDPWRLWSQPKDGLTPPRQPPAPAAKKNTPN